MGILPDQAAQPSCGGHRERLSRDYGYRRGAITSAAPGNTALGPLAGAQWFP